MQTEVHTPEHVYATISMVKALLRLLSRPTINFLDEKAVAEGAFDLKKYFLLLGRNLFHILYVLEVGHKYECKWV